MGNSARGVGEVGVVEMAVSSPILAAFGGL